MLNINVSYRQVTGLLYLPCTITGLLDYHNTGLEGPEGGVIYNNYAMSLAYYAITVCLC